MSSNPINVYIAYAPQDEALLLRLRTQLTAVERIGMVDAWHDGEIEVGMDREAAMLQALHAAPIILLLISADFFASEFAYEKEMKTALQLQESGKAKVLPIILRECTWKYTPLVNLKVLPTQGIPVTNPHWQSPDRAFAMIVEEVAQLAQKIQNPGNTPPEKSPSNPHSSASIHSTGTTASSVSSSIPTVFPTVLLNNQEWMAEDLQGPATEGTLIQSTGGDFYDFKAALTACPTGWRLPTKADWLALEPDQINQLQLNYHGIYDRKHPLFRDQKGFYWSGERSRGGEAWCFEKKAGKEGRVDSRYTHWAMHCRLIKI